MNTNISHQNMVQALMKALYQNNLPTITDFLNQGVNVNLPYNDNGWTPFMWVCKEFYETDVVKMFLAYGGDVYSRNKAGETPFMIAAKKRSNPDTLDILLKEGSNINAQDNLGNTALMKVVQHPQAMMRLCVIEFLIKNGANVDIKNNEGKDIWDYVDNNKGLNEFILCTLLERCAND